MTCQPACRKHVQLAQTGSTVGQCFAGALLVFNEALGPSHQQGFLYLQCCLGSSGLASLFMALCHETGRGTECSLPKAWEAYQAAIRLGLQVAKIFLLESSQDVRAFCHCCCIRGGIAAC